MRLNVLISHDHKLQTDKQLFSQYPRQPRTNVAYIAPKGPAKSHETFQRNILQHCCAQRVTRVWPHCSNMLRDVARCCKKLDGVGSSIKYQAAWMLEDVARVWTAPSQHLTTTMLQDVACVWPGLNIHL